MPQKIDDFAANFESQLADSCCVDGGLPGWAGEEAQPELAAKGRFYGVHEFCNCLIRFEVIMNQRPIVFLVLALACIVVAFILNFVPVQWQGNPSNYISVKEVKAIDVIRDGKSYTLNSKQQNQVIDILNHSVPTGAGYLSTQREPVGFSKLVIHRNDASDIEIEPIAYVDENLDFSAPQWYKSGNLTEMSNGTLKNILESAK